MQAHIRARSELSREDVVAFSAHTRETLSVIDRISHQDQLVVRESARGVGQLVIQQGLVLVAEELLERTLADSERILGPDHPSTLTVRANLAGVYQQLGRSAQASVLLERTLADSERILVPDHPSTLTVRARSAGETHQLQSRL